MAQIFGTITHASNISTSDHLMAVLENVDAFNSNELEVIKKKTAGRRYRWQNSFESFLFFYCAEKLYQIHQNSEPCFITRFKLNFIGKS